MKTIRWILSVTLLTLGLAACAPEGTTPTPDSDTGAVVSPVPDAGEAVEGGPVNVGSKDFTEELLLGEMYALILDANNVPVERSLNLAGTQVAHEALLQGEIDLYPEYTGTGYLFILGNEEGAESPEQVYQQTAEQYREQWNLIWLEPAPMNNTNAIACTQEVVDEYGLQTLSDLSEAAPNIRFAAIPDFEQRPDGLAGLRETYGGFEFQSLTVYDPGLKYRAVREGQADCVIAFSTDGQISAYDLVLMEDDQGLWPPYQVAPVVRAEVLEQYPQIEDSLNELAPLLTNDVLSNLNWQVDGENREYADVAAEFLQQQGIIE